MRTSLVDPLISPVFPRDVSLVLFHTSVLAPAHKRLSEAAVTACILSFQSKKGSLCGSLVEGIDVLLSAYFLKVRKYFTSAFISSSLRSGKAFIFVLPSIFTPSLMALVIFSSFSSSWFFGSL